MAYASAGREAVLGAGACRYERHRPEQTLLYPLVEEHYPAFVAALAAELWGAAQAVESAALLVDDILPAVPIRQWVVSFPCALGFLFATRPAVRQGGAGDRLPGDRRAPGEEGRGDAGERPHRGGDTDPALWQRAEPDKFAGSDLEQPQAGAEGVRAGCPNNIHSYMLFVDGVYVEAGERLRFRRVKAPERAELEALVQSLSERVGRHLERQGLLERDAENGYLALEPEGEEALAPVLGSSIVPTASRSARTRGARPSPCAPWRRTAGQMSRVRGWPRPQASPCTPGCWPRPESGTSSSGCAVTLRAQRGRDPAALACPAQGQVRYCR
jgi:hypothetical protein